MDKEAELERRNGRIEHVGMAPSQDRTSVTRTREVRGEGDNADQYTQGKARYANELDLGLDGSQAATSFDSFQEETEEEEGWTG